MSMQSKQQPSCGFSTRSRQARSKPRPDLWRRHFIRSALSLPLGGLAGSIGGVSLFGLDQAVAAQCDTGARSLVCIFLTGGADSFNMFVPADQRYDEYLLTRKKMAVAESDLVSVGATAQGEFAFHRLLASFGSMYGSGQLAVISNVGPLTRPTTAEDYGLDRSLPQSLFAHDAQQRLWQTAAQKVSGSGFGWGGAIAQQLAACNTAATMPGAFSMAGSNAWQNNPHSRYTRLNPNASIERMFGLDPSLASWIPLASREGTAAVLDRALASASAADQPLMLREAAASLSTADLATRQLESALSNNPLTEWVPDARNQLEVQLHLVTRLISAREQLNMQRQVFFVELGGWDTHSDQNERLPLLFSVLNNAIGPYQDRLESSGLSDSVTSFTASDFGRTLTSNGDGTDHGWGGHNFVFGAAVQGGRLYGDFPSYASVNNSDDAGTDGQFAGRIIPTMSVSQYGATLARWMGVENAALDLLFPDLVNFNQRDIGFMG